MLTLFLGATPSVDAAISGYSGIFNVPTAEVQNKLVIAFRWLEGPKPDLVLSHADTGSVNRMYVISLPFLALLETTVGALSVDGWPDSDFPHVPNGFHRAITVKLRTPHEWPIPALAIGTIDPLSVNQFNAETSSYGLRNYYAVGTQRLGPFAVTAGWGLGDRRPSRSARLQPFLDGVFGALALALPLGFELLGEWDARALNYGARWAGPWGFSAQWGRVGAGFTAGATVKITL